MSGTRITRLKVSGFKNLVDVDIRFSPFTCIAGANGVGKSNLFDAIQFLSALSDRSLIEAAKSVRDESGKTTDIRSLFHRVGDSYDETMSFEVEMIVPKTGMDDLGQEAEASSTFLRYILELKYVDSQNYLKSSGSLEILHEKLVHIKNKTELQQSLRFNYSPLWLNSVFKTQARKAAYISTELESETKIRLHQDSGTEKGRRGGAGGKPRKFLAQKLPRTVLSDANATESPTALLARREMQSWRILQLEPSALRKPDDFMSVSEAVLGVDGSHLPATLYRLAHELVEESDYENVEEIYSQIANNLAELITDVKSVSIDRDEKRQLLTLLVTGKDGTSHPAKALSDGTLRFLALAVLALDPNNQGVMGLEEPENGIHPERIPAILNLLQHIATDVNSPVGVNNPLRQVIINTHSPAVVQQIPEDSLLVAELKEMIANQHRYKGVRFSCLPHTWRTNIENESVSIISMGKLLSYLNPVIDEQAIDEDNICDEILQNEQSKTSISKNTRPKKVWEREDIRQLTLFPES
ncbi:MAG: AAA family ATPase [Snowella sp.]|nr:AAA family ATPase [Snowella sp.]